MNELLQQKLKWEQKQRLTMLEATVFWSGSVSTAVLMQNFGISRVQASKDFSAYQTLLPDNIRYDKSAKRYVIQDTFLPAFMAGTVSEFLQVLKIHQTGDKPTIVRLAENLPGVELVEPVIRQIDAAILKTVNQAVVLRKIVKVRYQSMSSDGPANYELSPHALVFDGMRWHVRAFSVSHGQFRDFVLARMVAAELMEGSAVESDRDHFWHTFVEVNIAPHPGLSDAQKQAVEFDFAMRDGILSCNVRAALVNYFLLAMRIGPDDLTREAKVQQIILLNRDELVVYLWQK